MSATALKKISCLSGILLLCGSLHLLQAQCGPGYTATQLNWDNLDYYFNSGSNVAPYGFSGGNYVTNAMEQTQRFAIGTKFVTLSTSAAGMVRGENLTHTGDVAAGFLGADAQYQPTANGQTITINFSEDVANVRFTLYDVDLLQRIDFAAVNAAAVGQNINVVTYPGSILTINNNNAPNARIVASNTAAANNVNTGTATITVAGPVKTITLTITTIGSNAVLWLSDINACVLGGGLPTNWHQGFSNRPFVGPTQNQPDYFLVTPDNKSVYYMDPGSGRCYFLFSETSTAPYVNALAYDPVNRYMYYVLDGTGTPSNNKTLKRFDCNTETFSVLVGNISTAFGIPTFDQGVESASAAFYDSRLYLGIEGGRFGSGGSTVSRESIVYTIPFNASQVPQSANQVYATEAYKNGSDSTLHDWADIIIKDGILYDYNTARAGSSPNFTYRYSAYHHFNMMTGNLDAYYQNPNLSRAFSGQAGLGWNGQLYFIRDSVGLYNGNGTVTGPQYRATVVNVPGDPVPPGWVGGAGDASDPFRPKCDFGDAPASFDPYSDPATESPAVHERSENIRLGASWSKEFWKRGVSGTEDSDDGIPTMPIMPPGGGGCLSQVTVFNNSGANATLIAWLDYNGNGQFDPSEANFAPITVPSSPSNQNFWLWWPSTPNSFINNQYTYMRVRITAASAGMTVNHPTGYFQNGEVEDYLVLVDNYPMATHFIDFNAAALAGQVKLDWSCMEDASSNEYWVERSTDNTDWVKLAVVPAAGNTGKMAYTYTDNTGLRGNIFYRVRAVEKSGANYLTSVKRVELRDEQQVVKCWPNPAREKVSVQFELMKSDKVTIGLYTAQGTRVLNREFQGRTGMNTLDLSLPASIPGGVYYLRVAYGGVMSQQKFMVIR